MESAVNKSNLTAISTNCNQGKDLSIACINACSACNKSVELVEFTFNNDVAILAVTKTWLSPGYKDKVIRCDLTPDGFQLIDSPRRTGRGGGVAIILKESIKVKQEKHCKHS